MQESTEAPEPPPFTLASLGVAVGVCVAWYAVAVGAFYWYADGLPATPREDCTGWECMSPRGAMHLFGLFIFVPTAFVSLLTSLVLLVFTARRIRPPWLLGSVAALAGMALGACGYVTIATFDG